MAKVIHFYNRYWVVSGNQHYRRWHWWYPVDWFRMWVYRWKRSHRA